VSRAGGLRLTAATDLLTSSEGFSNGINIDNFKALL
jgi:hypothetical protein